MVFAKLSAIYQMIKLCGLLFAELGQLDVITSQLASFQVCTKAQQSTRFERLVKSFNRKTYSKEEKQKYNKQLLYQYR
ncbi:hypothetical protein T10_5682 [Trichinella papuae]|uniref:Uncharacterized protein n=1 Tax=Trichinella papuae TaxID=268474 RepID=A0A0V1N6F0_9BILA|nr:hypothetical protein T10_5682 [Trichinella papuae]